ncbi:MAG: DUF5060 domain-containing protein [Opitutaceae bacterium]
MKLVFLRPFLAALFLATAAFAADPAWLPPGLLPPPPRHGPDLCPGAFLTPAQGEAVMRAAAAHFTEAATWNAYAARARRDIQKGMGLLPWPRKTPLNAILRARRDYDGYCVESVAFESVPGFYETGTLYRPLGRRPPFPAVLTLHGHTGPVVRPADWRTHGRFAPVVQLRAASLARMGAVVLSLDMFGYGDTIPEVGQAAHPHPFSMTIQTWNSIRAVDLLCSLPYVDPRRIAMTGESGGATQTLLATALDPRIAASIPVVMVNPYFFGGCPCESGLPIHRADGYFANNALIAALAAPRPMLVVSDGRDWTRLDPQWVFPFLSQIYRELGAPRDLATVALPAEGHDYGPSKRTALYRFLGAHFGLDPSAVFSPGGRLDESKVTIETPERMHVWNRSFPLPADALHSAAAVRRSLRRLQAADDPAGSASETLSLSEVRANTLRVPRYGKFELTFQARGPWTDPFDPGQVAIDCQVTAPDGRRYSVPAFYYQDYSRAEVDGRERLTPLGAPCWKARLAATQAGTYRCQLRLTSGGRSVEGPPERFVCTGGGDRFGFIRVSAANPHYFERDGGRTFFAVGEDILFSSRAGTYAMARWMTNVARAGGNLVRTWWCYGGMDLESKASASPKRAAGWYDLKSAWRADRQVALAERLGIALIPTIETQQYLRAGVLWEDFSYNRAHGGPLASPGEYFTSAAAARLFRNRLRYIVARWSYSPAIFSWMFWNEVDSCNDYNPAAVAAWHRTMADYLRSIDPDRHLIDTNFGNMDGRREVDDLPQMDFVATNLYTRFDEASASLWAARFMSARRDKPYLLTEFGLGAYGRWAENDPDGIALQNGLWGCAFGGSAGGAMVWEWDDWVDRCNLYHLYTPFADFMRDVPFATRRWRRVDVEALDFRDPHRPATYADVFFGGFSTNYQFNTCPKPLPTVFTVTPQGNVDRPGCFSGVLAPVGERAQPGGGARNDAAVAAPPSACTLLITMPREGRLIVHVPRLSGAQHPILAVDVDGRRVIQRALSRRNPDATWDYFGQFPVNLTAGRHRVVIRNLRPAGPDNYWSDRLTVAYELTHYRRLRGPDLKCAGLQSGGEILLWLRNPGYTWLYAREGRKLVTQPEGRLHLDRIPDGRYTATWIDTETGKVLLREVSAAQNGDMVLTTPAIAKSAAAKIHRLD